jgi:transposase-like protein
LLKSIETVYPWTQGLLCIVHQMRRSLKYTQATASAALIAFTEE